MRTHIVTIENMRFSPENLVVRPGERIIWKNKDLFPHTATAVRGTFDSGSIAPESSWSYVAGPEGEYSYVCTFHPTMRGHVRVQ